MAGVYGPAGIPVFWNVNLVNRQVEVYTGPRQSGYGKRRVFKPGQSLPVVVAGKQVGRIAVSDMLPPEPAVESNGA